MEEIKTSEDLSSEGRPEEAQPVFPKKWIQAWGEVEARIREWPGPSLFVALVFGYALEALPCRALGLLATLGLRLLKPALFWLAHSKWLNT
jgi:hypothetical protein